MDAGRWEEIQSLFHSVADLPEAERAAALRASCGGDQDLMNEVMGMLAADGKAAAVLDDGVERLAERVMGAPVIPPAAYQAVGPYQIQRVLGEGGMGTVFLGVRADLGSVAAIKILRDAWISPARRARFSLEQRTLARLDHPNIARLLDADTLADGTPFFVMEYVDGEPLDGVYCERHSSSLTQRLRLFRSVCEAVQFAHQHAVIHRDLKPSNILVTAGGAVKLLDFGIAKHLGEFDAAADLTRTGLRLMTPAYASPEQIRGERAALHSDVYSLGVVLYQVLTGRLPFDMAAQTTPEAALQFTERDPVRPSMVARRVMETSPGKRHLLAASASAWAD